MSVPGAAAQGSSPQCAWWWRSVVAALGWRILASHLQESVCVLHNLTDEDTVSSCLFTTCAPCVFASLSVLFASQAWFILVCALSLRWLRVMVTLKVCVCCSSILSSSDTLMKGHHAKAWRKPARNLKRKKKRVEFWDNSISDGEHGPHLWFRQQ